MDCFCFIFVLDLCNFIWESGCCMWLFVWGGMKFGGNNLMCLLWLCFF